MYVAIFARPNAYSNWLCGNNLNVYQGLWVSPLVLISSFKAQEVSVFWNSTDNGLKTTGFYPRFLGSQRAAMLDILPSPDGW